MHYHIQYHIVDPFTISYCIYIYTVDISENIAPYIGDWALANFHDSNCSASSSWSRYSANSYGIPKYISMRCHEHN